MAGIKYNHNMFTVGMISQKLQGNTESETYNNSLLDCKNFYIRQTGGVFKRPGTIFVKTIEDALRMKLFPFNFSGNNSIVLGFQTGKVYAYNTDGEVANCNAESLTTDVINDERFMPLQNGDSVYLFTKVGVFEIKYDTEAKTLTFAEKKFTFAPVGIINDIKTNAATYSSNTITLTGTAKFKNSDVGQRALLLWERPVDPNDTEMRYMYQTTLIYSYFTIASLTDDQHAVVVWDKNYSSVADISKIPTEGTFRFALPAFGADRGWPVAAGILANRLFVADKDLMIYGSRISYDDIFDFTLGADETCALSYRMNNDVGAISWITGQDKLFVGSPTGIYASGGSGVYAEEIIAPGNFSLRKFSSVHAGSLLPTAINAAIVFTDALGKNVYEISVDETVGVYKTFDLSLLSNELLNSGCISHTWSSYPVKTYWVACKDGTLASMTYEKSNNVLAWSYHDLGGENAAVESVASIQIDGYDYVFLVVRRTFNGTIIRKIEYIDKLYEPLDNKQYQQHYADSGQVFNYKYQIQKISQYQPPRIDFLDDLSVDSPYNLFIQNEDSKNQYIKCLFYNSTQDVAKDLYVEKAWRNNDSGDTISHVSFCGLEEKVEHLAPDGRDLITYTQKPLDVNTLRPFTTNVQVGVMLEHIDGIIYDDENKKLVLLCDHDAIPNSITRIILNDTGMKDSNNNSYDISSNNIRLLTIVSRDVSMYTTASGIIVDVPNGYTEGTFNPDGLREIYGDVSFMANPYFDVGSNAIVEQQVDVASAIAIEEVTVNVPDESSFCGGIAWDSAANAYIVAYGSKIYNVSSDWGTWRALWTVPRPRDGSIFRLYQIESGGYIILTNFNSKYYSATAAFDNVLRDTEFSQDPGTYRSSLGLGADGTYWIALYGYATTGTNLSPIYSYYGDSPASWGNFGGVRPDPAPTPIAGCIVNNDSDKANARTFFIGTEKETGKCKYYAVSRADNLMALMSSREIEENETRKFSAVVPIGSRVNHAYSEAYLVGEGGLIYKADLSNLYNVTFTPVNTDYTSAWAGGISYTAGNSNITFLYSKEGELLKIVETQGQDPKYFYQQINITSDIDGIYYENGRIFLTLDEGGVLRSIPDSDYTQSYFNTQFVFIDDVIGMESVNGKKYQIKNIDTTTLPAGYVRYELWDNGYPLDTRSLGVYDTTAANNGNAFVYFNTIVGLGALQGQKAVVSLDGNFLDTITVSDSGTITFEEDVYGMEAHVGYQYTSVIELMPLSGGNVRGSSVGSVGSQKSAFARLYYALGGKYGTESDKMYPIAYPTALFKSSYDKVVELFSGIIELPLMNPRDYRERKFRLEQSEPVCFNVLSIAQDAEISDA